MKSDFTDELYLMHKANLAWKDVEKGKIEKMPKNEFLKELFKW